MCSLKDSILIVDDDHCTRSSLSAVLQPEGYFVTATADAEEALQLLSAIQYDLVFLDLSLPSGDGMEVLARIHALNPELPVLILTSNASLEIAVEALRQGAAGYLLKPFDPEQILSRVKAALKDQKNTYRRNMIIDEIQKLLVELDLYE